LCAQSDFVFIYKFNLYFIGILVLLSIGRDVRAQEFRYDKYDLEDCAPGQNLSLQSIHQDVSGNMLLLTNNGLYKYDGLTYRYIHGTLPVEKVIEQKNKQLLVTSPLGVWELLLQADTFQLNMVAACPMPVQVYTDRQEQVWIAGSDGTILKVKAGNRTAFKPVNAIQNCFFVELNDILWMATLQGQWFWFSPKTNNFVEETGHTRALNINTILKKSEQTLWIGTASGIQEMMPNFQTNWAEKTIATIPDVNCLFDDEQTNIYIGTKNKGLFSIKKDDSKNKIIPVSFSNTLQNIENVPVKSVFNLCMDRDRDIWISSELGMSHLHAKSFLPFFGKTSMDDWTFLQQAPDNDYYFSRWGITGTLFRLKFNAPDNPTIPVWNTGSGFLEYIIADQHDVWTCNSEGKIFRIHQNKPAGTLDLSKRGSPVFNMLADSKHRI
jgi:hypothetical protein